VSPVANQGTLILGDDVTGSGTYVLAGSGFLRVLGSEIIGNSGSAVFDQSAGTNSIASIGSFVLGSNAGSNGTYLLSGTGLVTSVTAFVIGNSGNGTFHQTGGTNDHSLNAIAFDVGKSSGGSGSYLLDAGTLLVAGDEFIGHLGFGTFNQGGGTHT